MKKRKKELKVVVLNPEQIPKVAERFTQLVLDLYKDEIMEDYEKRCKEINQ